MSGLSFIERQLISYEDEMTSHCVGSIPELFDGNPPFKGRGAVSFAMNVAEILRILKLLKNMTIIKKRRNEDESFNVWMGIPPHILGGLGTASYGLTKGLVATRGHADYLLHTEAMGR